jgi:uncharacterized protein (DUF2267 family)
MSAREKVFVGRREIVGETARRINAHQRRPAVHGCARPLKTGKATTSLMSHQQGPRPVPAATTFEQLLEEVRCEGVYPTRAQTEQVVDAVLTALGRQLTSGERLELAAALPREAAASLTSEAPAVEALTNQESVMNLASRAHGTAVTSRWDAGTVLCIVARLAGEEFISRILARLPPATPCRSVAPSLRPPGAKAGRATRSRPNRPLHRR